MDSWINWIRVKWSNLGGKLEDTDRVLQVFSALIKELKEDGWFDNPKTIPEILTHIQSEIDKGEK